MASHVMKPFISISPKINIVCYLPEPVNKVFCSRWKIALVNYWFSKVLVVRGVWKSLGNDGFPGLTGYHFINTIYILTRKERKPFLIYHAIWLKWKIWLVIVDQLVRFGFSPYFPSFVTLIEIPNERIFFLHTPTKHMTYSHMRYHRSASEEPAVPNGVAIS